MRILIYGLGGVGGYIVGYLSQTSNEIVGVARGEHLKMIQENGLLITEDNKEFTANFTAIDESELSGYFDLVLFCVKSYDLKNVAFSCKSFLSQQSIVLSLSNGVEHGDELRKLLDCKVLDGCIYILSHIEKAGQITKMGNVFNLLFAGEGSEVLASVLDEAGLRYKIADDIHNALWKKYIFISTFGVLTSYFDMSIKEVYENHYDEAKEFLEEVVAIAKAKNIDLEDEVEKSLAIASKLPQSASTSMHKDIKAQKKDELETLGGYLVREANRLQISAPNIEKYYSELQKLHH
ncbi:MAG: 2-dehydropantoate 2-reductase [Thiovulaceae bacterium]|nr:2-dehydropantoate 2-reductase [Sulfurimonadaceae bacterium]